MMENTRAISDIKIGNRARKDMGDIAGLAASIADVGLLHPVVISKTGELIAGERRIRAFELLGKTKILVTVVDLAEIVRGEHAENEQRKDFTLTEAVAIKRAVEPLMAAEAKVRMVGGKGADGSGGRGKKAKPGANLAQGKGKTRDNVAKHTGKKASSLAKAEKVIDAAEAEPEKFAPLVEEMDRTGKVDGAYKQLKTLKASPADIAKADRAEQTAAAAKARPVAAPSVSACDEMPDVAAPHGTTPAGQRRFNFLYRASQAIDYGKHIAFEDAEPSEITLEIIAAAHGAASVWTDVVSALQQRAGVTAGDGVMKGKADRAEGDSVDPLALPEFLKR